MAGIFLFNELPEDKRDALLHKAKFTRHPALVARAAKERANREAATRNRGHSRANEEDRWRHLTNEARVDLHDGWCRIFALNRFGVLSFVDGVRLEEEWLERVSSEVSATKAAAQWPRGLLPKSNPWKSAHFTKVAVLKPEWLEDIQQFRVAFKQRAEGIVSHRRRFLRDPKKRSRQEKATYIEVTYYFKNEIIEDPNNPGYLVPRKQSQGVPWKHGGKVIRGSRPTEDALWHPDDYDMDRLQEVLDGRRGALEVKTHLVRKLRRAHKDAVPFKVKECVELWLEALGIEV